MYSVSPLQRYSSRFLANVIMEVPVPLKTMQHLTTIPEVTKWHQCERALIHSKKGVTLREYRTMHFDI